jgi:hypothetical protein
MRKAPAFDLSTKCTACGFAVQPKEVAMTSWETMCCPKCGVDFAPEPKGIGVSQAEHRGHNARVAEAYTSAFAGPKESAGD